MRGEKRDQSKVKASFFCTKERERKDVRPVR